MLRTKFNKYLLPYTYGFASRAKTPMDKLSFFCIWAFPLLFVCYRHSTLPEPEFLLCYALAATAQYSLYEIGYLKNDYVTTRREKSPNYRLPAKERAEIEKILPQMTRSRFAWAFSCTVLLGVFEDVCLLRFCAMLSALIVAFTAHNLIRCRLNIATYFLLCTVKYTALPFLFFPNEALPYLVFRMLLCFIIPRTFEHASKEKYGFRRLWNLPTHLIRVRYYAVLSAAAVFAAPFFYDGEAFLRLAVWYFLYRTAVYEFTVLWGDPRAA